MELQLNSELVFINALQQAVRQLLVAVEPDPVKKPRYYLELGQVSTGLVQNCSAVLVLSVFYHGGVEVDHTEQRRAELHFSPPAAGEDVGLQLQLLQGDEDVEVFSQFMQFCNTTECVPDEGVASIGTVGARVGRLIFDYVVTGVVPSSTLLVEQLQRVSAVTAVAH